ncbi:hypothetical protein JCM3775_002163 [Rhodotorula graminis]|uniref:MYND-type domain-containing protein n=1 Tax=Rhodotorula graminis (strain WP1) TaxID=578459 RepID=A0A0P9GW12_RHOGW|nr:uncharacterized protein RHOBADRAFT_47569 [Rhodotorula graminis WP1]KPV71615.1 hypothetical protein RHOBADRAFT_47569 [Rhodotorula graminis WP1]
MSSEWDQTCLVCGIKTENRCSSCAKAGIDLFFCSPDHQKLVWKAHRRVCGPGKANPFMWPLLSQLEADEIIEHMHDIIVPFALRNSEMATLAGAMCRFLDIDPEQLKSLVRYLVIGAERPLGDTTELDQLMLAKLRAFEPARRARVLDAQFMSVPYLDPITATAHHDVLVAHTSPEGNEPWRTEYRHLMLVQLFLGQTPPVEWFDRIFARSNAFVRTEIEPQHPRTAEKLLMQGPASEILAERLSQYNL